MDRMQQNCALCKMICLASRTATFYVCIMLQFAFIMFLLSVISTAVIVAYSVGFGWLLSRVLPVTESDATLLIMGATIVVVLGASILVRATTAAMLSDDDQSAVDKPTAANDISKAEGIVLVSVSSDEKCPCGSRRKYKNCHGALRGYTALG